MRPLCDLVSIGCVVKPQGRRGEVLVAPWSDRPERFAALRRAYLETEGEGREVSVVSCWPHKGRFVLKLDGVDSIDAAERLRGRELMVGEEELPLLPQGSYYFHQLQGLAVVGPDGEALGTVSGLLETGATPVLVVRSARRELLIPLAAPFVRQVALEAERIVAVAPIFEGEADARARRPSAR